MPVPLIVTVEGLIAMRTIRCVSGRAVVCIFFMAHLFHSCGEDFLAKFAFERTDIVYALMILQSMLVYEAHVAHIADIVTVMTIHVL